MAHVGTNTATNQRNLTLPPQKIAFKKKSKQWKEDCVDFVINTAAIANPTSNNPHRVRNIVANNDMYDGRYSEEEMKYITNPFNVEDGLPARLKEYNLIRPMIDSMIGEEVRRPLNFSVHRTSEGGSSDRMDKRKDMLMQYVQAEVMNHLGPEEQQAFQQGMQDGSIMPPEEIQRYMTETYKDIYEVYASALLRSLIAKLDVAAQFHKGYMDLLKNDEEIYYVGEEYGRPNLRYVNPAMFSYEWSPELDYIEDATWCSERMFLSFAEIHDRYKDEIDDDQYDKILDLVQDTGSSHGDFRKSSKDPYPLDTHHLDNIDFMGLPHPYNAMSADCIEVWKVHWRSFRKIFFVTFNDPETNHPYTEVVDESYVKTGEEEDIVEEWIMQVWQGYRVTNDIYFGIRPITMATDWRDPTSIKLPYIGQAAKGKSVIELLKPMQVTYLALWYRLELLLARDNGRALVMDITQIPKSMGIDVQRWAHMLKSMGVVMINPYENAWNIPGRDGTRPASFSAFSAIDLSMAQSITMYIELINKVEQMAMSLIGFNPQRLGQVQHRDSVGTTQHALEESYNTTAYIFFKHDRVKKRALEMMLNTAMAVRFRDDDTFISSIGDDGMKIFMDMEDMPMESMDLYVSNSQQEQQKLQQLQQLFQPAMQNGATLVDIVNMMSYDNLTQIRLKLEEIERRKQEMMQQQEQQQQAIQQAQMQQVEADRQVNIDQKNADRNLKKYESDLEAQTKIQIAELQAKVSALGSDMGEGGELERAKLELEEKKIEIQMQIEQLRLDNQTSIKERELETTELLKERELETKRDTEMDKLQIEADKLKAEKDKLSKELSIDKQELALKKAELEAEKTLKAKELEAERAKLKLEHDQEIKKLKIELEASIKEVRAKAEADMKMQLEKESHEKRLLEIEQKAAKAEQKAEQAHAITVERMQAKLTRESEENKMKIENKKLQQAKIKEKMKPKPPKPKAKKNGK